MTISDDYGPTDDDNPSTCKSCGVPYIHHLGIIGTCADLLASQAHLKAAQDKIRELQAELNRVKQLKTRQRKRKAVKP